jgi:regulatory associated protein of mTOR
MVKCRRDHKQWITNIHMQRGGMRELVSGSRNGEIRLWDIRMDAPVESIQALNTHAGAHAHAGNKAGGGKGGDTLRTLSAHEHAPVFAVGSDHHSVMALNVNGNFLGAFEPYSSFLHGTRGTPISATAFHPHRIMLGCAARGDQHANLVGI